MRWSPLLLLVAACSLTPIPDVTSSYDAAQPPDPMQPCPEAQRVCAVEFTMKATTERTVELRGDFRDGGWVSGVPMERDGGLWAASIDVPWSATVQYKFFLDGSRWILDPANTQSVPDGKGNTNSIVRNLTCASWSCVTR